MMGISGPGRKLLWGRSGGFCSNCRRPVTADPTRTDPAVVLGEEAHIVSAKPSGPRHRPMQSRQFDAYDNFILLCPEDHTLIDKRPTTYPEEMLRGLKHEHEVWVKQRSSRAPQLRILDPHPKDQTILRRMDTGTELMDSFTYCVAWRTQHPDPMSEDEANLLGSFVGTLHEWSEIWGDVDPGKRVKVKFQMRQSLEELREAGFVVYVGVREMTLEGGVGGPTSWPEALLSIHRLTDPLIASEETAGRSGSRLNTWVARSSWTQALA